MARQAEKELGWRRTIEGIETARLNGKQLVRQNYKIEYESTKQKKREIYKYSSSFNGITKKDKEIIKLWEE